MIGFNDVIVFDQSLPVRRLDPDSFQVSSRTEPKLDHFARSQGNRTLPGENDAGIANLGPEQGHDTLGRQLALVDYVDRCLVPEKDPIAVG